MWQVKATKETKGEERTTLEEFPSIEIFFFQEKQDILRLI